MWQTSCFSLFRANSLYCLCSQPKLHPTLAFNIPVPLTFFLVADLQAKASLLHLAVRLRWPHLSHYLVHQVRGPTRWSSPDQEGDAALQPAQGDGQKAPFRFLIAWCSESAAWAVLYERFDRNYYWPFDIFKGEHFKFVIFTCSVKWC